MVDVHDSAPANADEPESTLGQHWRVDEHDVNVERTRCNQL
jgi:hypothetical protein